MVLGLAIFAQEIDYSIAANYEYKYLSNTYQLNDTTLKIVWRENRYDTNLKQTVNTIVLNDSYFSNITDPERAALGYIATMVGNECQWDGGSPNAEKNNIECIILSALNLSYQCSEANKEFFRKWFTEGSEMLRDIDNCNPILFTATVQTTIDKITLTTGKEQIKIKYTALSANIRKQKFEQWSEELTFKLNNDKLEMVKREKKVKK